MAGQVSKSLDLPLFQALANYLTLYFLQYIFVFHSGEKEKKHKKKLNLSDGGNASTQASSVLMKMISTTSAVTSLSQAVSPSSVSSISLTSAANTPAQSTEGSPQDKTTIKTETDILATDNSMNSHDGNISNVPAVNGLSSGKIDESFVPQLPSNLPLSVEACVQKLKIAANNGIDEGKCKFFNKDVNQILLE